MPPINGRFILDARVAAVPRSFCHLVQNVFRVILRATPLRIRNPVRLPLTIVFSSLHELVRNADRKVRILEHDRAVCFAVEVGIVLAGIDQRACFLFFFRFALDEFHDVRMPVFKTLHLGSSTSLASRLHDSCNLIINTHEAQRARR